MKISEVKEMVIDIVGRNLEESESDACTINGSTNLLQDIPDIDSLRALEICIDLSEKVGIELAPEKTFVDDEFKPLIVDEICTAIMKQVEERGKK